MTSLQWHNFRSNDMAAPLSVEEIYRRYGAWAGIHSFSFDTLFESDSEDVVGLTGGIWTQQSLDLALPANFTFKYHTESLNHGIAIIGGAVTVYILVDSSGNLFIGHDSSTAQRFIAADQTPTKADVEIVFRQQVFDDLTGIVWRSVTLYMNGRMMTTFSDYIDQAYSDLDVYLMAFGTATHTYTNISVPELGDTAEFGTLDPGENALGGLQRTTDGRYLKNFIRWDGSLRAWKKKQRGNILTLTNLQGIHRSFDIPQLITHARMMGAYVWAEKIEKDLIILYGHRFQEVNNSMLLTQSECEEEATNTIKRSEESAFGIQSQARHIPILEPEDRITIDGEEWVIKTFSINFYKSETIQVYTCVKYVWGD